MCKAFTLATTIQRLIKLYSALLTCLLIIYSHAMKTLLCKYISKYRITTNQCKMSAAWCLHTWVAKKKRMAAYILQLSLLDTERLEVIGIVLIYLVGSHKSPDWESAVPCRDITWANLIMRDNSNLLAITYSRVITWPLERRLKCFHIGSPLFFSQAPRSFLSLSLLVLSVSCLRSLNFSLSFPLFSNLRYN